MGKLRAALVLIALATFVLGLVSLLSGTPRAQSFSLPPVELLVVEKSARRMLIYSGGELVRTIEGIQLGDEPVGPKQFEGDERTPEGRFTIDYRNPDSHYHLSLHISYPDAAASEFAASVGRSAGGDIFIHGQPDGHEGPRLQGDWTDGCIAVSNEEIEALWDAVADGTPIEIKP